MISASSLAQEMVDAIDVKSQFFKSFVGGALELPVDVYYLGYDFMDTENRWENGYESERLFKIIKRGFANKKNIAKIARIIIDRYLDKIDVNAVKNTTANVSGKLAGSVITNRLVLGNIGTMFSERLVAKMLVGFSFSSLLSLGALQSRAIYTSRELNRRDPDLYDSLRRLGDLDLLYFLVEKRVSPFEKATQLYYSNRRIFNEVSSLFLQKVRP